MQFEWDPAKNLVNWHCEEGALLMVAHTITERQEDGALIEVMRVIKARPASRRERKIYEDENGWIHSGNFA
jgi:uncharacterized DUF497 family protein